eukprot:4027486-Amphidinium_carterae.1
MVGKATRVLFESVVYCYEALVREAFGHREGELQQFFRGAGNITGTQDTYKVQVRDQRVVEIKVVKSFGSATWPAVMGWLRSGCIVRSKQTNEPGVEFLSPLFAHDNDSLKAAIAWQVKGGTDQVRLNGKKVPDREACEKLLCLCEQSTAAHNLRQSGVTVIPGLIARRQLGVAQITTPSVQILGEGTRAWLRPVMPLQSFE